jgi:hypothetical protein
MKMARLVCAVLALSLIAGSWSRADACDAHKAAAAAKAAKAGAVAAAAKGGACTAEMAAKCTPEMMAACKASMAAGGPDLCLRKSAGATAVTAAATGATGASATPAVFAAGSEHCGTAKAAAVTAAAHGACATKATAVAAGSGACGVKGKNVTAAAGHCSGFGMASVAAGSTHPDCEACLDMADCSGALDAAGALRQAVRLKNGVMYVYTADSPRNVSAVQAAVARRSERLIGLAAAGDKARLCAECKAMRGAMASGKLTREVVNIEGGSLTLITSNDASVVARIHAMSDPKVAARVKS